MWEIFFSTPNHTSYGTTQPYIQCVMWCFHGSKWPGCGVDHPTPYSAAIEHVQSYTSTPPLSLHLKSQKDLNFSPLGGPCHRYVNGYWALGRHDLKQANRNSNAGNHQTAVHYKPDLVKHFRLTLVTFLAPVH
jgi:hypothetical protein